MCGISGVYSKRPISALIVEKMNDKIKHRGPDDEGYFIMAGKKVIVAGGADTPKFAVDPECLYLPTTNRLQADQEINLALGHRRLSILDLSVLGHQPMCDNSQRYWIAFNGEVYNYREIRSELKQHGYTFRSDSDTEVVLAALSHWGIAALNKFVGMWAIAFFDRKTNNLKLIRDRYGIKPLYYWISPSGILHFASEIKQFSASEEWDAAVNTARALDYLTVNGLTDHTDETLYKDVYQINPGCLVDLDLDNLDLLPSSSSSFRLNNYHWYQPSVSPFTGNAEQATSKFFSLFKQAVDLHLTSDVNVGFALSGGLDSSSILCTAQSVHLANKQDNEHVTFSAVSDDKQYSEHEWIDIVHKHLEHVDAHFISPEPSDMFTHFEELLWHLDEPHQSQSAFFGFKIFESAKDAGVKVLLNGQGADEYLSCYGAYRHMFGRELGFSKLTKLYRAQGLSWPLSIHKSIACYAYDCYFSSSGRLRAWLFKSKDSTKMMKSYISDGLFDKYFVYPFKKINFSDKNAVSKFQLYFDALPRYLRWEDRNSMAHSVEARVPFLDHRLVEFCHNLPLNYLENGMTSKMLLVESMRNILPEEVRLRKDKKGFITPEEKWFLQEYTSELRIMLSNAIKYSNGFIKSSCINDFDRMITGKIPFDLSFWRIIVFGYWMKVHNVKFVSE